MQKNVLLVYPEIPPTYWSLRYAMPFIGKKAAFPPVGLLTVAALLPESYHATLVDMNVTRLKEQDITKADLVFVSAMIVQRESLRKIVALCNKHGKPVVAGGPYPTSCHEQIEGVDHFVLNEGEVTLPQFLEDYEKGQAKHLYRDDTKPDITKTPAPRFELADMKRYASMAVQYSRGCPHNCEFCDIVELFGRVPRTKEPEQFVRELDLLHQRGHRGSVFILDDNFIGNRRNVRRLLPEIAAWQREKRYPFDFFTEATVSLAQDEPLMESMVEAGFNMVFLGIETPDAETLRCIQKGQNLKSDLLESVRTIQRNGMEVTGGFIVGFDTDPEDIFERQSLFIRRSGIPTAMVGLLMALPNTRLYKRLKEENRLLDDSSGNNTHDLQVNFRPKMNLQSLMEGYKGLLTEVYSPKHYFNRCLVYLKNLKPHRNSVRKIRFMELRAFAMSLVVQTCSSYRWQYWKFLIRAFLMKPRMLAESVTMAIKGHHFFKITRAVMEVDRFKQALEHLKLSFEERVQAVSASDFEEKLGELKAYRERVLSDVRREYRRIHKDFQVYVEEALTCFEKRMDEIIASQAAALRPS